VYKCSSNLACSCSERRARYSQVLLCPSTSPFLDLHTARCKPTPSTGKTPRRRTCPRYFHETRPDRSEHPRRLGSRSVCRDNSTDCRDNFCTAACLCGDGTAAAAPRWARNTKGLCP